MRRRSTVQATLRGCLLTCSIAVLTVSPASIAQAGTINVNGTCQAGNCSVSNPLADGSSSTLPFDFIYTLANTDQFRLNGQLTAENSAGSSGIVQITGSFVTLTFLGNSNGTGSANDTIVVDFLQEFSTPFPEQSNFSGFEYISGSFRNGVAAGSNVTGQGLSGPTLGTAMTLMGPFFAPDDFSISLTGQPFAFGPLTSVDFRNTVVFAEGSAPGSQIFINNTPNPVPPVVPEPSTWLLSGAGVAVALLRKRFC